MTEAVKYLTSLAQALAKMSLYDEGHPSRGKAAELSFAQLRALQVSDPNVSFSFLGDEVIYAKRAIRELQGWDWAKKLSVTGVQRVEFGPRVELEEYRAFLEDVLRRLRSFERDGIDANAPSASPIRFGAVGVRGSATGEMAAIQNSGQGAMPNVLDLSEEADVVEWVHQEVGGRHDLPLLEAEAVVDSLAMSMRAGGHVLLPLLRLKEFDQYTTTHALNVSVLAMALADYMGLSPRESRAFGMGGLLHDLGKLNVPIEILRKPGAMTDEEFAIMKRHPVDGAKLILESDDRLDLCAAVAFEHHIMINGSGYPVRQQRCECHAASHLVHVCDVFDALRTNRPYRVAWEEAAILEYIEGRSGMEFDPDVTRAFLGMMRDHSRVAARADCIDGVEELEGAGAAF
jgi:putative nucleotidyltransferase with HDIG domain